MYIWKTINKIKWNK